MKKLVLGIAVSAMMAGSVVSVQAADPAEYGMFSDWSGFYIGAHAGYVWGENFWDSGPGFPINPKLEGFAGGGLAGYNYQLNDFVFSLEGDITFGDISDGPRIIRTATPGSVESADVNYVATIRARIGYAMGDVMPFVTGGLGIAELELFDSGTFPPQRATETMTGYVLGAGIEAKLDRWLSMNSDGALIGRVEYMYGNYGEENFQIGSNPEPADLETHTLRAALIWKFSSADMIGK